MSPIENDVLSLIAATIFADKRVYDSEVETFLTASSKLKILKDAKPKLSKSHLRKWYESNKDDIRGKITTPYFKDWLYQLLENLSEVPDKQPILDVMHDISLADGSVHVSERTLITLAKRFWGVI